VPTVPRTAERIRNTLGAPLLKAEPSEVRSARVASKVSSDLPACCLILNNGPDNSRYLRAVLGFLL
jgi:hypothetical protein